jgi:aspartate/tyrosine/aromatic aminotransferase
VFANQIKPFWPVKKTIFKNTGMSKSMTRYIYYTELSEILRYQSKAEEMMANHAFNK